MLVDIIPLGPPPEKNVNWVKVCRERKAYSQDAAFQIEKEEENKMIYIDRQSYLKYPNFNNDFVSK